MSINNVNITKVVYKNSWGEKVDITEYFIKDIDPNAYSWSKEMSKYVIKTEIMVEAPKNTTRKYEL